MEKDPNSASNKFFITLGPDVEYKSTGGRPIALQFSVFIKMEYKKLFDYVSCWADNFEQILGIFRIFFLFYFVSNGHFMRRTEIEC